MAAETRGLVVAGVKYDCKDVVAREAAAAKLPLSGGTMTGALNLKNNTWNNVGDDASFGDCNVTGCIGIKGLNGATGLNFVQYNGSAAGTIKWDGTNFSLSKALPVGSGGTGVTSNPSMLTNLGSTTAASVFAASPRPGVMGTLGTANGGTGITSNPSMLTNLGSTTAASVFATSPRPGVMGTLAIGNGGTGATTASAARTSLGLGSLSTKSSIALGSDVSGTLAVGNGGTGSTTAAGARTNLGAEQATTFTTFSGGNLTAVANYEYVNNSAINYLDIVLPSAGRGVIFGVNFTSSGSFTSVTFNTTVKVSGDGLNQKSKRYNLIVWYDGGSWWCASKAV